MLGGVVLGYVVAAVIGGVLVACFIWAGIFDMSILSSETAMYVTAFSSLTMGVAFAWYFFGKKVWRKYSVNSGTTSEGHTSQ